MTSHPRTGSNSMQSITLAVMHNQRQLMTVDLEPSNSVFVGSGSNCRIVLQDKAVKQIHCMIWQDADGILFVQDWNTGTTLVNGTPIDSEHQLRSSDKLTIGNYHIHWRFAEEQAYTNPETEVVAEALDTPSEPEPFLPETAAVFDEATEAPELAQAEHESLLASAALQPDCDAAPVNHNAAFVADDQDWSHDLPEYETDATLLPESQNNVFRYQIDADVDGEAELEEMYNPFSVSPTSFGSDSLGETDDPDLLRMEIEQLRFELSERDLQLQAMRDKQRMQDSDEPGDAAGVDESETLKLVARLEQLLEELDASDERVRNMEELLRLSDQATRAEQDERQQLESWVSEIESRIQQREAEAEAEKARLTSQLAQANDQIDQSQNQVKQLLQANQNQASSEPSVQVDPRQQELLQQFQAQVEELREQLRNATAENEQLRQRPQPLDDEEGDPREQARQLRQQLVEMQVEMSRERANTARQHAELERIRDSLESRIRSMEGGSDGDSKMVAVRNQLRSLQKEKQAELEDNRKRSLSGRIASLLTRVR